MYLIRTSPVAILADLAEYTWLPSEQRFVCTHQEIERSSDGIYCYNCRNEDLTQDQVDELTYQVYDEFDYE